MIPTEIFIFTFKLKYVKIVTRFIFENNMYYQIQYALSTSFIHHDIWFQLITCYILEQPIATTQCFMSWTQPSDGSMIQYNLV